MSSNIYSVLQTQTLRSGWTSQEMVGFKVAHRVDWPKSKIACIYPSMDPSCDGCHLVPTSPTCFGLALKISLTPSQPLHLLTWTFINSPLVGLISVLIADRCFLFCITFCKKKIKNLLLQCKVFSNLVALLRTCQTPPARLCPYWLSIDPLHCTSTLHLLYL